ncbi:hypothetical protein Tco_0645686 [Tanacetum coccineum]
MVEDLVNYHLKEIHCSSQRHTQKTLWIIVKGDEYLILCFGHAGKTNVITAEKISALTCGFWVHFFNHMGEEISCESKYALFEFPGGRVVRRIIQAWEDALLIQLMYYKDDSCWSADLKSKTTKDIISIGSFMEVLVLIPYVLVRKIF